jgi:phosphoglucomutase/phosphomannomutase
MDRAYQQAVLAHRVAGPRELRILYSPLHGVGASSVLPVLDADGFEEVEVYAPQAALDGDFPNVPGHVANPENPAVFAPLNERGQETGAHLILVSDPDADRIGCAAPVADRQTWHVFTGNQIAALLADFILRKRHEAGTLRADQYLVQTLVTSRIVSRLAQHYGVRAIGDVLTGFKWLGGVIDDLGPDNFLFAAEEAHGYLIGDYIRDKDAAGAAMLLAEMAAECHANGQTLRDALEEIFIRVGYHAEQSLSRVLPGAAGMSQMQQILTRLRDSPPTSLGGMRVARVRDYLRNETIRPRLVRTEVPTADCDLIIFDLEREGYTVAVRPSGTEPKLKCYLSAYEPPTGMAASIATRRDVAERLVNMEQDISAAFDVPASVVSSKADSRSLLREKPLIGSTIDQLRN